MSNKAKSFNIFKAIFYINLQQLQLFCIPGYNANSTFLWHINLIEFKLIRDISRNKSCGSGIFINIVVRKIVQIVRNIIVHKIVRM